MLKQRDKILGSFIHLEKNRGNIGSLGRKPIEWDKKKTQRPLKCLLFWITKGGGPTP